MQLPIVLKPPFLHDRAYCWRIKLPGEITWLADTQQRQIMCPLVLFENLTPLGPAHRLHADIAAVGAGQFSVWQNGSLYFSTSDNSDPNSNGRQYTLDFGEARDVTVGPGPRSGPAISEVLRAIGALREDFRPQQGYAAVRRGLDLLYPARVLDFNADRLSAEFADLELVTERYGGYRSELSSADAVFLSIFCAGRTWVRFFLQTYLAAATGRDFSLVPRSIPRTDVFPSLCFTHDFLDLFETIPAEPWIVFEALLLTKPLILMTRDLRDLAVSWFYYLRSTQPANFAKLVPSGSMREFIDSPIVGIERLAAVHKLERDLFARHPGPKMHLRYEEIHASPRSEFELLLKFLSDAPVQGTPFELALRESTFASMQALEKEISRAGKAKDYMRLGVDNWSGDSNDLKVRAGKVGRFREFLPELDDPEALAVKYPITRQCVV